MGMRSNGGVSIRRRWDALWGGITGRINGFVETGSLRGTGARKASGGVTIRLKAKSGGASASAAAKPKARRTSVSGTGSAKVDVAAKIAAGKAAAKKK